MGDVLQQAAHGTQGQGAGDQDDHEGGEGEGHHPLGLGAKLGQSGVDGGLEAHGTGLHVGSTHGYVGGVLTGEHGVGIEKRDLMPEMFTEGDLAQQMRVKCAFDDQGLLNPGKVFPTLHRCAELGRMHVKGGVLPFAEIPRF